ncbi:hypothetical protein QYM36_018359 [Artemia franciscana]|uniref:Uncharacterized protein n=1 Tax=Artemia franciscana TaxID=6661 RepID=A0AA88KU27_ARTSF|nr:hypothetical protein QYM36_018359 [Artemia franciscana]
MYLQFINGSHEACSKTEAAEKTGAELQYPLARQQEAVKVERSSKRWGWSFVAEASWRTKIVYKNKNIVEETGTWRKEIDSKNQKIEEMTIWRRETVNENKEMTVEHKKITISGLGLVSAMRKIAAFFEK